ncbi:MAG: HEPN domain-containing protein [Planctomycetes bacterium]|nr:HEPN domain-containing protein [Planctomycetota bacterium]MBM4079547.1 HEPN domain-containing protein [Planctomycetota bacterium]
MSDATDHRAWLDKAEEDWLCVRNNLAAEKKPWSCICFHAQQAAEKCLKALLVHRGYFPAKTHDLVELLVPCLQFDAGLDILRSDCRLLTEYAVEVRYPFFEPEVNEDAARQAVAAAESICEAVRQRLPKG